MNNLSTKRVFIIFVIANIYVTQAGFSDYVKTVGSFFGYDDEAATEDLDFYGDFPQKIPYEVSTADEKFISEAAKLTDVALSELDSCQHRVVFKLKTDCDKMNDEQLAKMAVHLLNCQSFVEGRKMYSCTDEMSIKDCTKHMDSDTWTSYHLMSNRARAVCYMIRQTQFRGLAEHTVNRLMDAARDQLKTLGKISASQENLQNVAEETYSTLNEAHLQLSKQQNDLQKAQLHGQLVLEDNIKRLIDEKRFIHETHNQLVKMTKEVQAKLINSAEFLNEHNKESKVNHEQLLSDLFLIQERTQEIFGKIEESASMLIKQNEDFRAQYESTLRNLQEVNKTVHNLVTLVGGTRQALEERLSWIMTALGGTDSAVERLYLILWHTAFVLVAMLASAFLSARPSTRFLVATLPPLNLVVALYGEQKYLDPVGLGGAVAAFVLVETLTRFALSWRSTLTQKAIPYLKEKLSPSKTDVTSSNINIKAAPDEPSSLYNHNLNSENNKSFESTGYVYKSHNNSRYYTVNSTEGPEEYEHNETDNFDENFDFITPPVSRNGDYSVKSRSRSRSSTPLVLNTGKKRGVCHAKTRVGTPCKLSSLPGRDFCYRHQNGDSVMG